MAAQEPKIQVNQFCQKKCGRQITKSDITYTTQKHGNAYQSTITLTCLGGVAFVGELVANPKSAESAAAKQVLNHYASEIQALASMPAGGVKRPASSIGGVGILGPADKVQKLLADQTPSGPTPPKKEIYEIATKIVKKPLSKNEVLYTTKQVAGGFQSTLQLTCLPGVYGQNLFTGTVCQNKKDAETSVATIAVQTLKADAEFAEILNKPKEIKKGKGKGKMLDPTLYKTRLCQNLIDGKCTRGKNCTYAHSEEELLIKPGPPALVKTKMCNDFEAGSCPRGDNCTFAHSKDELKERPRIDWDAKGKGKGKGKDFGMPDWMAENPMLGMMGMMQANMMAMMGMAASGGMGGGAIMDGPKDSGTRERVSTAKVSGMVEEWKGNFGWIKPSTPFEHPKANKHKGKIFLAKKDAPADVKAGNALTFHVYADNDGLGAEDVSA